MFFLSLGLFSPLKSRAFAWKERERESPSRVASLLDAKKGGGVVGVGVGVARQKKKRERERERPEKSEEFHSHCVFIIIIDIIIRRIARFVVECISSSL